MDSPDKIGPYRVIRPIARGGMAAVYEVEEPKSRQRLALKLLTQRGLAAPRFNREYRALARLNHPNILRVYRFGMSEEGKPYVTMELLDGVPAQVHAKAKGRPGTPQRTARVVRIISAVAEALLYLHARGIVHRDLKSSNVMVLSDGQVKLLDFGTARLTGSDDQITRNGEFVGTFAYASPEQLTGEPVDARSDIYSLGVLFYRLLTGKRPFHADTPHELAQLHLKHEPPPPDELVAGIRAEVANLVMRMLEKDPKNRPASASHVIEALKGLGEVRPPNLPLDNLCAPEVIGRESEVQAIRAAIRRRRPGRLIVVSGMVGSGRRRLLDQAVRDAKEMGITVLDGSFKGGEDLGGVAEIVRIASRGLRPSRTGPGLDLGLLTRAGMPQAEIDTQEEALHLVVQVLRRRLEEDRCLLLVLRKLDQASTLGLKALLRIREDAKDKGLPILILCSTTYVSDQSRSPLRKLFPDATRLNLGDLEPVEVARLVGAVLGRKAPPPSLVRRIHEATGGMPGYVVEIVHAMVKQGLIEPRRTTDDRVTWVDCSGGRIFIPEGLREQLCRRLDSLTPQGIRLLEALGVAGGEAALEVLAYAAQVPAPEAVALLQALEGRLLVRGEDELSWRFHLGLSTQLVRERTRMSRRRLLQQRLAEALRDTAPTESKIRILMAANQVVLAVEDAVRWARSRVADYRSEEVLAVFERLVPRVEEFESIPPATLAHFHLIRARVLSISDPTDTRADAALSLCQDLMVEAGDEGPNSLEVALIRSKLHRMRGEPQRAARMLRAVASTQPDPELRVAVGLELGRSCLLSGQAELALQAYESARSISESACRIRAVGEATVGCGLAHHGLGRMAEAEADLRRGIELYSSVDNDQGKWHATLNLADIYRFQGRFSESLALLEPHLDQARMSQRPMRYAGLLLNLAETQIELFRLGEVRDLLAELEDLAVTRTHPRYQVALSLIRGRLHLAARDAGGALEVLQPAVEEADRSGFSVIAGQLRGWLGEALALTGRIGEADIETRRSIDALTDMLPIQGEACGCRARALLGREDPDLIYQPVLSWAQNEPARLIRLTYHMASAQFATSRGESNRGQHHFVAARGIFNEISGLLSDGDRSALDVHPVRQKLKLAIA
jgi:tetratricopeptide (TPR) repeat protein